MGIEPMTNGLLDQRLSYAPFHGTSCLLLLRVTTHELKKKTCSDSKKNLPQAGLKPATPRLEVWCSIH